MMSISTIEPDWDAPRHIRAIATMRAGGKSEPPYESLNLATHVGDNHLSVVQNRMQLRSAFSLPSGPAWLNQTHSASCIRLQAPIQNMEADASWTDKSQLVCAVLTADCLPILITNSTGDFVAAVHAGWRGLVKGIIPNTLVQLPGIKSDYRVWLGPAISQAAFEVGQDVFDAFAEVLPDAKACFAAAEKEGKYYLDIYSAARQQLQQSGVHLIYGGDYCTYSDKRFFSYRRDGVTGRTATLIWMDPAANF